MVSSHWDAATGSVSAGGARDKADTLSIHTPLRLQLQGTEAADTSTVYAVRCQGSVSLDGGGHWLEGSTRGLLGADHACVFLDQGEG